LKFYERIFQESCNRKYRSANLLFENGKFNTSANRAYYTAFHIAIADIINIGIIPSIDHKTMNTLLSDNFSIEERLFCLNIKAAFPTFKLLEMKQIIEKVSMLS